MIFALILAALSLSACDVLFGKSTVVVFDNGLDDVQNAVYEAKDFSEISVPEDPEREGYLFGGWYFDDDFTKPFTLSALFEMEKGGTITVYAKWTEYSELEFTYDLYLDGSKYATATAKGFSISSLEKPEKKDCVFLGWYSDASFKNAFTDKSVSIDLYGEVTSLYAKMIPYSECEYKIKFTIDGKNYTTIVTEGISYALPVSPTKDGFEFVGWYFEDGKELSSEALKAYSPNDTLTVKALWKEVDESEFKIELYVDSERWETKYTSGGKFSAPAAPTKEHMTFDGWFYDKAYTFAYADSDKITADKKLYAKYSPIEIIATVNISESQSKAVKIEYGTDYTILGWENLNAEKKAFLGWALKGSETLVTDGDGKCLVPSEFDTDIELIPIYREYTAKVVIHHEGEWKGVKTHYAFNNKLEENIPDPVPSQDGMIFAGWYLKNSNGKASKIDLSTFNFTDGEYTVYAKFTTEKIMIAKGGEMNLSLRLIMTEQVHAYAYLAAFDFREYLVYELGMSLCAPEYEKSSVEYSLEIIIGAGAKYRDDEYSMSVEEIGNLGYIIKVVDDKIIIAGATDELTAEAFNYFVKEVLKINVGSGEAITDISVDRDIYITKADSFPVKSVTLASKSLSSFVLVGDVSDYALMEEVKDLIAKKYGAVLKIVCTGNEGSYENFIVFSCYKNAYIPKDTKNDGFVICVEDGNLYISCAYENAFETATLEFVNNYLLKDGTNTFAEGYIYSKQVSIVTYEDFGAVGDGVTDDFAAIYDAHAYANLGGQTVLGKAGAVYFIGDSFTKSIPVKTSVDFKGATFMINDKGSVAYSNRSKPLFLIEGDAYLISPIALRQDYGKELVIHAGDTEIPWLSGQISGAGTVIIISSQKELMRYPSSILGQERTERFTVDSNGRIIGAPAFKDISDITAVLVVRSGDALTVQNGNFKSVAPTVLSETSNKNSQQYYYRGISVKNTSGVTLKNITHTMIDEPRMYTEHGTGAESYPYFGFIVIDDSFNVTLDGVTLYAHTKYYISRPNNSGTVTYTELSSYDLSVSNSVNVTLKGLKQQSRDSLTDGKYSGLINARSVKNLTVNASELNRIYSIDIQGASFTDSTIGVGIVVNGFGDLVFDGVTRLVGKPFLTLPMDYGATLSGALTFKDCTFKALKTYNSILSAQASGSYADAYLINSSYYATTSEYRNFDFGFGTSLPKTITIDNLTSLAASTYVFNDINNAAFEYGDYMYRYGITEKIIFKNMSAIATVKSASCTKLAAIPVVS